MEKTVMGYAKINLHLDVTGIMADGYHSVETVMQSLSLCDEVTVLLTEDRTVCAKCNIDQVPSDERNIAVRAARLYLDEVESKSGAVIKINKRIPMAAGLAGGSADAAATLLALNELFDGAVEHDRLLEIGASLGADVPFCIACGTKYSDGRGDRLQSFPSLDENVIFVVACGGEGVSTPWGYRLLDESFDRFQNYTPVGCEQLKNAISDREKLCFTDFLFNIFEKPVFAERPVAKMIAEMMLESRAKAARMSGSGPSVFGVFDSADAAEHAVKAISDAGYFATVCSPVAERNK